jgi:hypothetical protein
MVDVAAVVKQDMQIEVGVMDNGSPEFLGQFGRKRAELHRGKHGMPNACWPTAQIDSRGYEGFIHGQDAMAETANARLVSESLMQSLTQAYTDIFHGVVGVDLQVPLTTHLQIE